jgi:hypothetical protein
VVRFFRHLQAAVLTNDSVAVASLVVYPLNVNDSLHQASVRTRRDFLQRYSAIFTPAVRHAVAVQLTDSLFANWQGIMIGNGQVWFGGECEQSPPEGCSHLAVFTINLDAPLVP